MLNDVLLVSKYAGKPYSSMLEEGIGFQLSSFGIDYDTLAGNKAIREDFLGRDMVIAFGGDGTVLDASKNILDATPLLTVKSNDESVGALCKIDGKEFGKYLERILNDDFFLENWDRVEGEIGNEKHFALNEIYVGPRFGSGPGRYDIIFHGARENDHRSSGIIAATGTGSTGWYANVEYSEGSFEKNSGLIKFAALSCKKDENHTIVSGTLMPGEELEIISRYKFDGAIDFDGYYRKSLDFPTGNSVKLRLSESPLKAITFPDYQK